MKKEIIETLSNGYVMGKIKCIVESKVETKNTTVFEIEKFDLAIKKSLLQIAKLKESNQNMQDYLSIQELMISDPSLTKQVHSFIEVNNVSAKDAVCEVMAEFMDGLKKSSSSYLKERSTDMEDVLNRIVENLNDVVEKKESEPYILFTKTLYPSYLIANMHNILGIITNYGGYTSHTAILCRSLDIPFVVCDGDFVENSLVIIDTRKGLVITEPSEDEVTRCRINMEKRGSFEKKAIAHPGFMFLANVSSNLDLSRVLDYGFDGIGLYRTEMIFMNTHRPYSMNEQYEIYLETVQKMQGKIVCFRTFDVGDDKQLPYLKTFKKGIDNYKNNPILFIEQVSAILKANIYGNVRIMFPMIESKEEFLYLKRWVLKIREENQYNMPKIGMMLETKEALEHIEEFSDADFISIGTNDLTNQLYQISRDDGIDRMDSYIDDLLVKLKKVVKFCDDNNICLSVCGELASVTNAAISFYKIGIRNLSVAPSAIRMLNMVYDEYQKIKE